MADTLRHEILRQMTREATTEEYTGMPDTPGDWFDAADRLTAIIESRMSHELAWLQDDGETVVRLTPEEVAVQIMHLYQTGDVVSGLPPREEALR